MRTLIGRILKPAGRADFFRTAVPPSVRFRNIFLFTFLLAEPFLFTSCPKDDASEETVKPRDIAVFQGSKPVPAGDGFDFGNVPEAQSSDAAFTIRNSGDEPLLLTGSPLVSLSGNTAFFTVTTQPVSQTVAARGAAVFTLRFTPGSTGVRTASVAIPNDDPDDGNYVFTVTGTGIAGTGYSVLYNGNGSTAGTVPVDPGSYSSGGTAVASRNSGYLEKTGWYFTGWNTAADGSGTAYAAGASVPVGPANVTLYARWVSGEVNFFIIDDTDSDYQNAPFEDVLARFDSAGNALYNLPSFNISQYSGGMHAVAPALEAGQLWLAENIGDWTGTWNPYLRKIDAGGTIVFGQLIAEANAVAVGANGDVYVCCYQTNLERRSTDGSYLGDFASEPCDVVYSRHDDTVVIAGASFVRKVSADLSSTVWLNDSDLNGFGVSLAADPVNGDVWVAVRLGTNCVLRLDGATGAVRTNIAGVDPYCVAVDPADGSVYVGDETATYRYDAEGHLLTTIPHGAFTLSVDQAGCVWTAPRAETQVRKYRRDGTELWASPSIFSAEQKFVTTGFW